MGESMSDKNLETFFEVVIPFATEKAAKSSKIRIEEHPEFGYMGIEVREVAE